jgi:hypothetical protein
MPRPKTPVSEYKKLMLRLPEDVLDAVAKCAARNHRSINSEILHTLVETLSDDEKHRIESVPFATATAL